MAFGACATIGGINAIKNHQPLEDVRKYVYGEDWEKIDTVPTMAVGDVVDVDAMIHGCPVSKKEMLEVITSVALGNRRLRMLMPGYISASSAAR